VPAASSAIQRLAGKAGGLKAQRPADDPERIAAEQNLAEAHLERHIARVIQGLPPLRPEQRAQLAALLGDASQTAARGVPRHLLRRGCDAA
jgi:hypothetical protein